MSRLQHFHRQSASDGILFINVKTHQSQIHCQLTKQINVKATPVIKYFIYFLKVMNQSIKYQWNNIIMNSTKLIINKFTQQRYYCSSRYIILSDMPPKKKQVLQKAQKVQKVDKQQKQTKLFSKEVVKEDTIQAGKSRSKQFNAETKGNAQTSTHKWEYGNGKTPNKLFISSWNVNGIRSVLTKEDLQKYLKKDKPDIICIGQTKIDEAAYQKSKVEIDGYHTYWNFCKCSSGYSGVAIFSKYLPISAIEDIPQQNQHSQEGRVITLEFEKFYLLTAYIPNAGQKLDRLDYRVKKWDVSFQNYCESLRKKKPLIICGDLNVCHKQIDIAKPKGNEKTAGFTKQERDSFSKFLANGWIDSFRELHPDTIKYSWWSMRTGGRAKNIGWRLDYFLINKQAWKWVASSEINNDVMGSDHCPIELKIDIN